VIPLAKRVVNLSVGNMLDLARLIIVFLFTYTTAKTIPSIGSLGRRKDKGLTYHAGEIQHGPKRRGNGFISGRLKDNGKWAV
jgi:hypothetical protein